MPDRPATTDVAHERAVLERHLLRPNAEHVLPGLWWDDTWVPGIEVGDTWMPAWFAAGMPMLGIPLGFGPQHVVAALGIEVPRGLLPHQRREWDDAHEDPEETWRNASPMPIDNPFLTLQTSPVLDRIAQAPPATASTSSPIRRASRSPRNGSTSGSGSRRSGTAASTPAGST